MQQLPVLANVRTSKVFDWMALDQHAIGAAQNQPCYQIDFYCEIRREFGAKESLVRINRRDLWWKRSPRTDV